MRTAERICGLLAGVCGLAGTVLALVQRTIQMHSGGAAVYAPLTLRSAQAQSWQAALFGALALAVVGAALVVLGAWGDGRAVVGRSTWSMSLLVGTILSIISMWLASINRLWVDLGIPAGATPRYTTGTEISLSTVFFPLATLAALTLVLAVIRHTPRPART